MARRFLVVGSAVLRVRRGCVVVLRVLPVPEAILRVVPARDAVLRVLHAPDAVLRVKNFMTAALNALFALSVSNDRNQAFARKEDAAANIESW